MRYHVYRVYGAGADPASVRVRVVEGLREALEQRTAALCLAI